MAKDSSLEDAITSIAASSGGVLQFRRHSTKSLGAELDIALPRSPNAIFEFTVTKPGASPFTSVAYTLMLDGSKRPATRAEALGAGLATAQGKLFDSNPFLLIFDYTGKRLLAVSAVTLFGSFAREVATRPIAASSSASFSLSPSFQNETVSMYATVTKDSLWSCSIEKGELTEASLIQWLERVRFETQQQKAAIPSLVAAIQSRLEAEQLDVRSATGGASVAVVKAHGRLQSGEIKVEPRVWRMIMTAIRSCPAVILVGPPGTGKTALLEKAVAEILEEDGLLGEGMAAPLWATPDESWTARDLVGGDTVVEGALAFRPGWVLKAIEERRWLVLDETNRADMDRIFGALLTWLSGGSVTVGVEHVGEGAKQVQLGWTDGTSLVSVDDGDKAAGRPGSIAYLAGEDWRLLGTYNALDAQRVFRFGSALGRRFARVPVPAIDGTMFAEVLSGHKGALPQAVVDAVQGLYQAHYHSDATRLGPALFLALLRYLIVAFEQDAQLAASAATGLQEQHREVIADAYVVHVGTWLAHLEEQDLEDLKARLVAGNLFTVLDWTWITSMIRSLA